MVHFNYTHFPHITNFVKSHFTQLHKTKPEVFEVFRNTIDWSERQAMEILKYENRPNIKLKQLNRRYGYTPSNRIEIQLHIGVVRDCEKFLGRKFPATTIRNIDVTERHTPVLNDYKVRDNILLLLEATILHELIHWCRLARVTVYTNNQYTREEVVARRFENAAYGKYATVHSLDICNQVQDPEGRHPKSSNPLNPRSAHEHHDNQLLPRTGKYRQILNE